MVLLRHTLGEHQDRLHGRFYIADGHRPIIGFGNTPPANLLSALLEIQPGGLSPCFEFRLLPYGH
uniref:Uncharacterized protein n=1 Tax=Hyaloperonospora arabidopsidis (strain Emoy2) TaxID=559515 RepID=M4B828_HYAAE